MAELFSSSGQLFLQVGGRLLDLGWLPRRRRFRGNLGLRSPLAEGEGQQQSEQGGYQRQEHAAAGREAEAGGQIQLSDLTLSVGQQRLADLGVALPFAQHQTAGDPLVQLKAAVNFEGRIQGLMSREVRPDAGGQQPRPHGAPQPADVPDPHLGRAGQPGPPTDGQGGQQEGHKPAPRQDRQETLQIQPPPRSSDLPL
ncbi:MAG: hypothetical protein GTO03_03475, partial [Planctomycetales bacterium]|nr:hypothetical protein [Planctomycetales bacterium]